VTETSCSLSVGREKNLKKGFKSNESGEKQIN
jgi:hypothetical protein